jgi:hypothetical protein
MTLGRATTMVFATLALGGCGSAADETPSTTSKAPISTSVRELPSYETAKTACGAVPRVALARSLGVPATDAVAVAKKYAERHAPLARRQGVYEGCYAALTR